jgi:lipid II:glycine glycyltransferase (peptidoglycan interpeptide bridge formation enzyme)
MNARINGFQAIVGEASVPESSSGYQGVVIDDLPDSAVLASWSQLLAGHGAHFFQTPEWLACLRRNEKSMAVLTFFEGRVVASSVVRRRSVPVAGKGIYIVERGPVSENATALEAHLQQLVELCGKDAVAIRISPYEAESDRDETEATLGKWGWKIVGGTSYLYDATVTVDLGQDIEAIRRAFRRSLRTQINKARKAGIQVRNNVGSAEFSAFVREFNAMARRRGLAPIQEEIAEELESLNGKPGGAQLFVCEYQGEQVAGALMIPAADRIIYRWGYSSEAEAHRQLPLSHALHWEAMQWARENGYPFYDFGGYWEERGDEDPINRFKTGFSKHIEKHVREHVLVLRPGMYGAIRQLTRLRARFS